ncbi:MAG: GNAT family N-acetyltransferase [Anaerolineae bacterium]|jgi:RimJ/RimL family protein N-acetyltransferase
MREHDALAGTPGTVNLLQGNRLRLTALDENDLQTVARWQENATFLRLFDARPAYPRSVDSLATWLEERHKAQDAFLFGVRLRDGTLIGYVELDGILWAHGVGWTSIALGDPARWGQGYGSEAMALLLSFAFNELNLHRVQLTVFDYNDRAIALYEKLGFRREGAFRQFMQRDGERHDMYLYGLLREEWASRSQDSTESQ